MVDEVNVVVNLLVFKVKWGGKFSESSVGMVNILLLFVIVLINLVIKVIRVSIIIVVGFIYFIKSVILIVVS